jgi:hypothetical protein
MNRLIVAASVIALGCGAGTTLAGNATVDETTGLIVAPGWQLVRAHCGGCHAHALVTAQRADRQSWLAIIRWMQDTQNLWQFDPATENGILDYLAENYPPEPNRRRAPIPPHLLPQKKADLK